MVSVCRQIRSASSYRPSCAWYQPMLLSAPACPLALPATRKASSARSACSMASCWRFSRCSRVAEVEAGVGLPGPVADVGEGPKCPRVMGPRLVVPFERHVRLPEVAVGLGLYRSVPEPDRRVERGQLGRDEIVEVAQPVQVRREGPGQLPGV